MIGAAALAAKEQNHGPGEGSASYHISHFFRLNRQIKAKLRQSSKDF
ncbi:hypothetical protein [Leptothrix discophora]|uniref:Uncharacterized protein n=1 Tax=Leptothrix discophora TaxID=89 RepID=A0ABT9G086_LEPDI|nr:hypothetical protein [Leptothrix discophora]MDP4299835.1 hypothetical protein [Leptothrix discophora]